MSRSASVKVGLIYREGRSSFPCIWDLSAGIYKNIRKVTRTMLSTVIRIQFKMIQNRIQFWCNMKNWINFGVLMRTCGLCIV
jgi:hypothetical protein